MVIGKCTDVFRGFFWLGEGVIWGELSMEEFVIGEENFHEKAQNFLALKKMKK